MHVVFKRSGRVCVYSEGSQASFTLGAGGVIFLDVNFTFDAVSTFLTSTSIAAH